jgi:predicted dehydrogenase
MRHFCGEISGISAIASNAVRHFEVEDTVAITVEFESGALGTFLLSDTAASSKSWEMTSGENPAYPQFPDDSCYHFAGTNGSLDFPSMKVRYYNSDLEPSWWNPFKTDHLSLSRANPLERQLDHFVQVVCGAQEPRVSSRDGYRNMLVVEAIRQSIASGSRVDLASV